MVDLRNAKVLESSDAAAETCCSGLTGDGSPVASSIRPSTATIPPLETPNAMTSWSRTRIAAVAFNNMASGDVESWRLCSVRFCVALLFNVGRPELLMLETARVTFMRVRSVVRIPSVVGEPCCVVSTSGISIALAGRLVVGGSMIRSTISDHAHTPD